MPSLTLLGQAVVSGLLAGGIYSLLALGLSLSWGLLRLVNLAHFALALLGAYLTYQLGTAFHVPPWLAALAIVPAFFVLGMAFLLKAGMWPVGFWLPRTYAAAVPPSAAVFALLTSGG